MAHGGYVYLHDAYAVLPEPTLQAAGQVVLIFKLFSGTYNLGFDLSSQRISHRHPDTYQWCKPAQHETT